jgi:hypothetical protein
MNERDRRYLRDVLDAIEAIENFAIESRGSFMSARTTQSAVVRQIEIIGDLTTDKAQQFGVIPAQAGIQLCMQKTPGSPPSRGRHGSRLRAVFSRLLNIVADQVGRPDSR